MMGKTMLYTLAAVLALPVLAEAAVVNAADSFNYPTGALLGQGSAADPGWGGPWALRGTGVGDGTVASPGMIAPVANLDVAGNKITANGTALTTTIQAIRPLAGAVGSGAGDTTVWLSFIGQKTNTGLRTFGLGLYVDATGTGAERLTIGNPSAQVAGGSVTTSYSNWGIYTAGQAATFKDSGIANTSAIFGVLEIVYDASNGANATAYFYVNPALGVTPSHAGANATISGVNLEFGAIRLAAGQQTVSGGVTLTASNADFDELHVGSTFAAVSPAIPEPAALGLVGVVTPLLARRRR